MPPNASDNSRNCERCGRRVYPRGPEPPRYCPVCGQRLVPLHDEVRAALTTCGGALGRPRMPGAAIIAFICGLIGLVPMCGAPAGLIAIFVGLATARRIAASGGRLAGQSLAAAAVVLGIVGVAASVLAIMARA